MIYFSYRDADDERDQLLRIDAEDEMMVLKPGILPGDFGYPDLHVAHVRYLARENEHLIICVTDYPPDETWAKKLVERAEALLKNNSKEER